MLTYADFMKKIFCVGLFFRQESHCDFSLIDKESRLNFPKKIMFTKFGISNRIKIGEVTVA